MKRLVICGVLFMLVGCTEYDVDQFESYTPVRDDLKTEIEYGEVFDHTVFEYEYLKGGQNLVFPEIDTLILGETHYEVLVDEKTYPFEISVIDTQFPKFKGKTSYTIFKGETLNLKDHISASDPVDGELEVSFDSFDQEKVGTQRVVARAKDFNDNESELEIEVVIKEKPAPKPVVPPTNTGATIIKGHLIVNKKYPIPNNYASGENSTAASSIRAMIQDMKAQGLRVSTSYSGFRTYHYQKQLYEGYVRRHGQKEADTFSAKPGHSEHQSGLAYDLKSPNGTLLETEPEITWVREHAHEYGFTVRYPKDKVHITKYMYEPWHLRYLGSDAKILFDNNLTLEEYLGVGG